MSLTDIGFQKTPGRPVEISFAANLGEPSDLQELILIGHAATGGSVALYQVNVIANAGSISAASTEVATKFGSGSELAKMVLAAVAVNVANSTFPNIKCVPLAPADTGFGASDVALTNAGKVKGEYLVSPYDGNSDTVNTGKIIATALAMSGSQRVDNNQFGTIGVAFNRSVVDPTTLHKYDTQYLMPVYLRDTGTPAYSVAEEAAAAAALLAGQGVPFNPVDSVTIPGVAAPASTGDWLTVGAGLESEAALNQGWTPLYVKPNGEVAVVRSVTSRLTSDGITPVNAYYDVQDFNVLYFFRKTVWTRFSQPDFKQRKASSSTAQDVLSEVIRLATLFQDQQMFQAVDQLAKQFQVQRNASDRSRFDVFVPVNVVPGLHVLATNVQAGTQFDIITI